MYLIADEAFLTFNDTYLLYDSNGNKVEIDQKDLNK